MLDFWATWCGPCVQELPILTEVAESYKGKGVAFFAINLRETPEQIKKFQEEKKLKFTVALDTEGDTGTAYNANAIPMLVLVDKKGVVRVGPRRLQPGNQEDPDQRARCLDRRQGHRQGARRASEGESRAPRPRAKGWSESGVSADRT